MKLKKEQLPGIGALKSLPSPAFGKFLDIEYKGNQIFKVNAKMAGVNNLSDAYRSRDNLRILAIADNQRNKEFLPKVPTFKEQGYGVDDSSVNFRGIMVRKGTPKSVIDKLAEAFPKMFANPRVQKQMKNGGSPIRIMNRDEVREMWNKRQVFLEDLLKDL